MVPLINESSEKSLKGRDIHGPLQALESNFIFGMGLMHYPLYIYQPSTPNE